MPRRLVVFALLFLAGCLWRGYSRVLEVHLEVLESMSVKMCGLTKAPPPPSEAMGEFVYPAKRAREVLQQYGSRSGLPSYVGFGEVAGVYEGLVRQFDRARISSEAWTAAAPQICQASEELVNQIATLRQQLKREG